MQWCRVLGLVGVGTLGIARQAWAQQPVSAGVDPEICSQWKSKLEGAVGGFSDFQALARGIGIEDPVETGFDHPVPVGLLSDKSRSECLDSLIASNPNLHDAAEFMPVRFRLLNANGDGTLDKAEVETKIAGARTPADRKKNLEAAAYAALLDVTNRPPQDASPLASVPPPPQKDSPVAAQIDKTLRNAQEKNRYFFIMGAAIVAAVMVVVLALKRIAGIALWRSGLLKIFPSQHQRLLKGPRRKALRAVAKIDAAEAAALTRLKPKKKKAERA